MKTSNSKGDIWYGLHAYPGVAQYQEPGKDAYRIFLNENTLREMDRTFEGRPVFVQHVDEVNEDLNTLRAEVDGWVVESFFNPPDGKHWVKFVTASEAAKKAIRNGWRLSNCYVPKSFNSGGLWNGVDYSKEVTSGEYEHLAIVPNPRYEESVIMTPEQFKKYNEDKLSELKRIANEKEKEVKFEFFKRKKEKIENDLSEVSVILPKSKKEVLVSHLINQADEIELTKDEPKIANGDHLVDVGGSKMTLNELVEKYDAVCKEVDNMKKANEVVEDMVEEDEKEENEEDEVEEVVENKEDVDKLVEEEKRSNSAADEEAKRLAKEKADKVRNANRSADFVQHVVVDFPGDGLTRGKQRYGAK